MLATLIGSLAASGLLAASSGNAAVTVLAVLMTGFGTGPVFPVIFAISNSTFRGPVGTVGSLIIAMGSIGAALLPWLQGLVFAGAGPSTSILVIAVGSVGMLVLFGGYYAVSRHAAESIPLIS